MSRAPGFFVAIRAVMRLGATAAAGQFITTSPGAAAREFRRHDSSSPIDTNHNGDFDSR
jgi:hypothetical protein